MKLSHFLLPVLFSAALAGCVSKPTVKLNHAEINGVQVGFPLSINVVMTVVIEVTNPNSYDVAIRAVHGVTTLAGQYNLPVEFRAQDPGLWLPAKQTTLVGIPVNVPAQLGIALLAQLMAPSINYHFQGRADVTATRTLQLEKDDYSVDVSGDIPRQQLEGALRIGLPHLESIALPMAAKRRVVVWSIVGALVVVGAAALATGWIWKRARERDRREIEPYLAAYSHDGADELAIAWMAVNEAGDAAEHLGARVSFDGGKTLRDVADVTSPGERLAADPSISFAPDGASYLTWLGFRDEVLAGGEPHDMHVFAASRAKGEASWGAPWEISVGDSTTVYDRPRALATTDGLVVVVRYSDKGRGGIARFSAKNGSIGAAGAPVRRDLFESIGFLGGIPTLCSQPSTKHIYVAWFDPIAGISLIADAGGAEPSAPRRASVKGERVALEAPYCFVEEGGDGKSVSVVYGIGATPMNSASSAELATLVIARSHDAGVTFDERSEWHDETGVIVHPSAALGRDGDIEFVYYAGPLHGAASGALRHAIVHRDGSGTSETLRSPLALAPIRSEPSWIGDYIGFARSGEHGYVAFGDNLGHLPRVSFLHLR